MRPSILWGVVCAGALAVTAPASGEIRKSVVVRSDGVHLEVIEAGDPRKPGLLFIHGYGQSHLSFRRQFSSDLANAFHLVAFGLRGQGASDKPNDPDAYRDSKVWADDVAAVISATQLKKPVLVAWSYGGYVAMDYVRHHGVDGIVGINIVGSTAGLVPPWSTADTAPAAVSANPVLAMSIAADLSANIEAARRTGEGFMTANMSPEEREAQVATELMMPAYVRRAMLSRDYGHPDVLPKLTLPMLLSVGSEDTIARAPTIAELARLMPQAEVSIYQGGGHLPFVQFDDRFNDELKAFAVRVQAP